MSEKGQGETQPVGTGTVLAEPGADGGATAAPQSMEGRQPTEAEREAGRWLDEPQTPQNHEGRQPTDAEREAGRWLDESGGGAAATGSPGGAGEWLDENTFVGPGGMPFEFQPTEGKPAAPPRSTPNEMTGEGADAPPARSAEVPERPSGRPSEGPTQVIPPDIEVKETETKPQGSVLEHTDTRGETPSPDDDQRTVMS